MKPDDLAPQGDFRFSRALTDADFQALSLHIAQARGRQSCRDTKLEHTSAGFASSPLGPNSLGSNGLGPSSPETLGEAFSPEADLPRGCQPFLPEPLRPVHCNRSIAELVEHALLQAEGVLSHQGALCIKTLPYSGTTHRSLYRVTTTQGSPASSTASLATSPAEPVTHPAPYPAMETACSSPLGCWLPMVETAFEALYDRALDYGRDRALYQCQGWLTLPQVQPLRLRVVCELASQALMVHHWLDTEGLGESLFAGTVSPWPATHSPEAHLSETQLGVADLRKQAVSSPGPALTQHLAPSFTIVALPGLKGEPLLESELHNEVFIALHPKDRLVLLGGSRHGGDLLRAIALALETLLEAQPQAVLLPGCLSQCDNGTRALFLGAPGSGKQSLARPKTQSSAGLAHNWLVWSPEGLSSPLAGDYVSLGGLTPEAPQAERLGFGSLLENVRLDEHTSMPCYDDYGWTRNLRGVTRRSRSAAARASLGQGEGSQGDRPWGKAAKRQSQRQSQGTGEILAMPDAVFLLIADVAGVLPPLARLTIDQALYYLLLGYGAALPDWERQRPCPVACFSHSWQTQSEAERAALLLRDRLQQGKMPLYLLNTGWLGPAPSPYHRRIDNRIPLHHSQALVQLALESPDLFAPGAPTDPVFGLTLPRPISSLPASLSHPALAWESEAAWQQAATRLASAFRQRWRQTASATVSLAPEWDLPR